MRDEDEVEIIWLNPDEVRMVQIKYNSLINYRIKLALEKPTSPES